MAYASANARFGYHHPQKDPALDNKPTAFLAAAAADDDSSSAVLDPSILDADMMQSPNAVPFRKDSFANSNNGVLSPADSQAPWDHQFGAGLPVDPSSAGASNPFHDDHGAYMRANGQHIPTYAHAHHPPSWTFEHASGECTPTTNAVDFMPPPSQFEAPQYQRNDGAHGSFSHQGHPAPHFTMPQADTNFAPAPQVQTPMSPHSHQDWMGMAQQEMEGRPSQKRMRHGSPPRSLADYQRRDGIRKKNGRIDIPQERNIQTIDELIEKTTDEELLKELKQQKRLLRNREAALASRQRKKKHTEDLEVKEKSYTHQINLLEQRLNDLTVEREQRERDRQMIHQRFQKAQRLIDTMHEEKRDLIMRHNEETSSLRKKVQVLTDQIESGPAPVMSAAPSSTGFNDFSAEMEALNMGPHDWDNFILVNDLHGEAHDDFAIFNPKPEPIKPAPSHEKKVAAIAPQASRKQNDSITDQPVASGLLFMLLLCGAFVASKPPSAQPVDLPNMPAEVRAAAPTVLNNLLSDPGPASAHDHSRAVSTMGQEPMPSGAPFNDAKSSRLDRMHRTITSPTKQQEIDQAFSLTQAQYASMTSMDYQTYDQTPAHGRSDSATPRRRPLAEALANMEQEHARKSKAEIYTRSLLWDSVPPGLVNQFRDLIRDHNEIEQRQQQQQNQQARPGHDFTYKIEQ